MNQSILNMVYQRDFLEKEIDRQRKKAMRKPGALKNLEHGMNIHMLGFKKRPLAKRLSVCIREGAYVLSPAVQRKAFIEGRERLLYRQRLTDVIVTSALARLFGRIIGPRINDRVFSYLKNRSNVGLLLELTQFITAHKRAVPDKKKRGLYVLKRDISAYGESIPTQRDSRLFALIEECVDKDASIDRSHPFWTLLHQSIRREIITTDGRQRTLEKGTPTGSPLQPFINNLYLTDLDDALSSFEGGFYGRYGDDFVFIHSDADTARLAADTIDDIISRLGLTIREEKKKNYYITIPGKKSDRWPDAINTTGFEYLGCSIQFKGTLSLKKAKALDLQRDIQRRIAASIDLLDTENIDTRCKIACDVVQKAIHPQSPVANRNAQLIRYVVDDRDQLKALDYRLALMIATAVTHSHSVKAFRTIPYKTLRRKYGLISLVTERNRIKKRGVK